MKANNQEFETMLSVEDVGNIFRAAVERRPLAKNISKMELRTTAKSPAKWAWSSVKKFQLARRKSARPELL